MHARRPLMAGALLAGLALSVAAPAIAARAPTPRRNAGAGRAPVPNRLVEALAAAEISARRDAAARRRLSRLTAATASRLQRLDRTAHRADTRRLRAQRAEAEARDALAGLLATDYTTGRTDIVAVIGSASFAAAIGRAIRLSQATGAAATTTAALLSAVGRARHGTSRLARIRDGLALDRARLAAEAVVLAQSQAASRRRSGRLAVQLAALRLAAARRARARPPAPPRAAATPPPAVTPRATAGRASPTAVAARSPRRRPPPAPSPTRTAAPSATPRPPVAPTASATPTSGPTPSASAPAPPTAVPAPAVSPRPSPTPASTASAIAGVPAPPPPLPPGAVTVATNLTEPSGIREGALAAFLAGTKLSGDAAAFLAAERTDHVSALFLAAEAILETGFGTSTIYRTKHNLYGWGADAAHPLRDALAFRSDAACIAQVAWAIAVDYLTPPGSMVQPYGAPAAAPASVATGRFYHGPTLLGMSVDYAGNGAWASSVATIADEIQQSAGAGPGG